MQCLHGVGSSLPILLDRLIGLLKRAHRSGFTLDVISVEDIAESADSKLFKSITHSNHCLHFLLPPVKDQVYSLRPKSHPYQLSFHKTHLFLVIFFVQCIKDF